MRGCLEELSIPGQVPWQVRQIPLRHTVGGEEAGGGGGRGQKVLERRVAVPALLLTPHLSQHVQSLLRAWLHFAVVRERGASGVHKQVFQASLQYLSVPSVSVPVGLAGPEQRGLVWWQGSKHRACIFSQRVVCWTCSWLWLLTAGLRHPVTGCHIHCVLHTSTRHNTVRLPVLFWLQFLPWYWQGAVGTWVSATDTQSLQHRVQRFCLLSTLLLPSRWRLSPRLGQEVLGVEQQFGRENGAGPRVLVRRERRVCRAVDVGGLGGVVWRCRLGLPGYWCCLTWHHLLHTATVLSDLSRLCEVLRARQHTACLFKGQPGLGSAPTAVRLSVWPPFAIGGRWAIAVSVVVQEGLGGKAQLTSGLFLLHLQASQVSEGLPQVAAPNRCHPPFPIHLLPTTRIFCFPSGHICCCQACVLLLFSDLSVELWWKKWGVLHLIHILADKDGQVCVHLWGCGSSFPCSCAGARVKGHAPSTCFADGKRYLELKLTVSDRGSVIRFQGVEDAWPLQVS